MATGIFDMASNFSRSSMTRSLLPEQLFPHAPVRRSASTSSFRAIYRGYTCISITQSTKLYWSRINGKNILADRRTPSQKASFPASNGEPYCVWFFPKQSPRNDVEELKTRSFGFLAYYFFWSLSLKRKIGRFSQTEN